MFIKPIASCSLVACAMLAVASTPEVGDNPPHRTAELLTDRNEISVREGGVQQFHLHAGPDAANQWYLILGSISGTVPGTRVQDLTIPLNYDLYTEFTLARPNAGFIVNQFGRLDGTGFAAAELFLPAGMAKGLEGTEISHAYVVVSDDGTGMITKVSNAMPLVLTD